jgi:AraC-like DNA-binding protein
MRPIDSLRTARHTRGVLLDRLLANLGVELGHVAVDEVAANDRLTQAPQPRTLILFGIDGQGIVRDPRRAQQLERGWLGVVPPGTPFSLLADDEPFAVACGGLTVRYHTGADVFAALPHVLTFDVRNDPEVAAAFRSLVAEHRHPRPGSAFLGTALANQCLVTVFRAVCDHPECSVPWLEALEDPQLAPALEVILEDPGQPHTVASLAAACHLSRAAFTRRFTTATGESPMAYLRRVRMREAARLLAAHRPVAGVAHEVGYASRSRFGDAFRREYGSSPIEFQARSGEE